MLNDMWNFILFSNGRQVVPSKELTPTKATLSDLEVEDDGPDETQGEAGVAVHDVVGAHIL